MSFYMKLPCSCWEAAKFSSSVSCQMYPVACASQVHLTCELAMMLPRMSVGVRQRTAAALVACYLKDDLIPCLIVPAALRRLRQRADVPSMIMFPSTMFLIYLNGELATVALVACFLDDDLVPCLNVPAAPHRVRQCAEHYAGRCSEHDFSLALRVHEGLRMPTGLSRLPQTCTRPSAHTSQPIHTRRLACCNSLQTRADSSMLTSQQAHGVLTSMNV